MSDLPDTSFLGRLLRECGRGLPDNIRTAFTMVEGTRVTRGSMLDGISNERARLLQAMVFLQAARLPATAWRDLLEKLIVAGHVIADNWPTNELLKLEERARHGLIGTPMEWPAYDPDLDAFAVVCARIEAYINAIDVADATVREAGFVYDRSTERLAFASGRRGKPRGVFGDLVRECLLALVATENTPEVREAIAGELAPFFRTQDLSTTRGSLLSNAVDNALRRTTDGRPMSKPAPPS